jgi:hypothetical protein
MDFSRFQKLSPMVCAAGWVCCAPMVPAAGEAISGPLRVSLLNPRYFTNDTGKAVYLTGSHTWNNLKDGGNSDPPPAFDYNAYLDFLDGYNHNFIRLWTLDIPKVDCNSEGLSYVTHFPWPRTGPDPANDGKPKFDLSQFDESYFARLRERVIAARDRGIYVAVMLFEGYDLQFCLVSGNGHPFDAANNINGINPASSVFTLGNPAALEIQKTYVRKVVDTLNDLDNVLYEIANEAGGDSTAWQFEMINTVKSHQQTLPKQHPVGMTFQWQGGDNATLFSSAADWISPGGINPYGTNPPAATGSKVVISDSDHIYGVAPGGDYKWVWRSFTRGLNPIYMDPMTEDPVHLSPRRAMGHTLDYARRMDLINTVPRGDLASTAYCLANPGMEYLVYQPGSGPFTVNLSGVAGSFTAEWFNAAQGKAFKGAGVSGGAVRTFTPPFSDPAVLYLRSTALTPEPSTIVSIVAPGNGTVFHSPGATVPVTVEASDRYAEISKVEVFAGGGLLQTLTSPPYNMTWNVGAPGNQTLTALATTSLQTTASSEPVEIQIVSRPVIQLFSVTDGVAGFLLQGDLGYRYRVDVSPDLQDWSKLLETGVQSFPGIAGGAAIIVDPQSVSHRQRFYRAVEVSAP